MEYEVKKGDGWYKIAKSLGVNINDLLKANNATLDTMLQPGLKLQTSKELVAKPISTWKSSAANDWTTQQTNKTAQLISRAEANAKLDNQARKDKIYQGQLDKTYQEMQSKDKIQALLQQLRAAGYDIGKFGADGVMGNATNSAIKQAELDGYIISNHQLVRKSDTNKSLKSKGNLFHGIMSKWANTPINPEDPIGNLLRTFYKSSYQGTEEDARKLGYKTYQLQGSFRAYPVNYTTKGNHTSILDRAQAQLDEYGITSEQTQDKSKFLKWLYEYLPGYGYNVLHAIENYNENTPIASSKTGKAVNLERNSEDSWAYQAAKKRADLKNENVGYFYGNMSPAREDYRNLYYGYPLQHNTLSINKNVKTKNNGEFRDGYAYILKSYDPINLSNNLQPGTTKNVVGGQFNNFTVGKTADGKLWYIDDWDLIGDDYIQMGRPFEIYNRK